jgi:acid phosphatase
LSRPSPGFDLPHHAQDAAQTRRTGAAVRRPRDDGGTVHPIPTIIVGEGIQPGRYTEWMNHYTLLRTIEKAYDLPPLGRAHAARPLSEIWKK